VGCGHRDGGGWCDGSGLSAFSEILSSGDSPYQEAVSRRQVNNEIFAARPGRVVAPAVAEPLLYLPVFRKDCYAPLAGHPVDGFYRHPESLVYQVV
jgi:hypothetical protein